MSEKGSIWRELKLYSIAFINFIREERKRKSDKEQLLSTLAFSGYDTALIIF